MRPSLRTLVTATTLATAIAAQNDFDLDRTTPGTLGQSLTLAVRSAPANILLLLVPSFNAGPTPISLIDPGDPRSLQVGLDLAANATFLLTSATGTASVNLPLPAIAAYQGIVLHWQALTVPGSSRLVDRISNDALAQLGMPGNAQLLPSGLLAARALAAAFANPTFPGGGDVLIAGGGGGTLTGSVGLASSEIWDCRHLQARPGPTMNSARVLHTATTLNDGRVLICGGVDALGAVLASCEVYDPVANTFTPTGSMASARVMHAAVKLADGRVMAAGGTTSLVDALTTITNVSNTVELWNPVTGSWSPGPVLGGRRLGPALSLLSTGRVLVTGGVQVTLLFGIPLAAVSTTATQIYNPATNAWSSGAPMQQGRAGHHYNQVTLNDGRVLLTGGVFVPDLVNAANAAPTNVAEAYDPVANTWTALPMAAARALHSASKLADGRVVVCGGAQGTFTALVPIAGVELFTPATNTWTSLLPLTAPRSAHAAVVTADGLLVLLGGQDSTGTSASLETLRF